MLWPMACPGLVTHTLAGLCALWMPSGASSFSGELHKLAKPQPPQTTTCPALPKHQVQASTHLQHTAEAAFDVTVAQGKPRVGCLHFGRTLCAVVAEQRLQSWKTPASRKTVTTHKQPPAQPCRSTQCRLHHACFTLQRLYLALQCHTTCPGLVTHTLVSYVP